MLVFKYAHTAKLYACYKDINRRISAIVDAKCVLMWLYQATLYQQHPLNTVTFPTYSVLLFFSCSFFSSIVLAEKQYNEQGYVSNPTTVSNAAPSDIDQLNASSHQIILSGKDIDGNTFDHQDLAERLIFLAIGTKSASEQLMYWQADVLYTINKRLFFKLNEAGLRPLSVAVADVRRVPKVTKLIVNVFLRRAEKRALDYVTTLLSQDGVVPPESFDEHFFMVADWDGSIVDQLADVYVKGSPNIFIISPQGYLIDHYSDRKAHTDQQIFEKVADWLTQYKQQSLHNVATSH